MESFERLSSLHCDLKVVAARDVALVTMPKGYLFVRCYLYAGSNKRVKLDTQVIFTSPDSTSASIDLFRWNESFSLDCLGNKQSMDMLVQGTVVFELRWIGCGKYKNFLLGVFGRMGGGSKLLARAEVPWKSVFESTNMEMERWVSLEMKRGARGRVVRDEDSKPPSILIGMRIEKVPHIDQAGLKERRGMKKWEEFRCSEYCGCPTCVDGEIFALGAILDDF